MKSFVLFVLHLAFIAAYAVSMQPVDRALQLLAYSAAVRLSLLIHALRLIRRCPPPRSLSALPAWTQDAGGTTEAFYIFGSFLLLSNQSGSLLLSSQCILATYHMLSYGRNLGPLSKPVQSLAAKAAARRDDALFAMGFLDILAFVQLLAHALIGGLGLRGLIQSFIYLNLVRNRSIANSNETSYYRVVWETIGRSSVGVAAQRLPFFDSLRNWFIPGSSRA